MREVFHERLFGSLERAMFLMWKSSQKCTIVHYTKNVALARHSYACQRHATNSDGRYSTPGN